jgi:hypothetical protein
MTRKDLVMARDYIRHGVRARAQSLVTSSGPGRGREDPEAIQRGRPGRLTRLDRSLVARSKDGILVYPSRARSFSVPFG